MSKKASNREFTLEEIFEEQSLSVAEIAFLLKHLGNSLEDDQSLGDLAPRFIDLANELLARRQLALQVLEEARENSASYENEQLSQTPADFTLGNSQPNQMVKPPTTRH